LYNIPGYTFITKNRTVGKGGSVGMYISDCYSWIRRSELEASNLECIWIELIVKNSINILIGTMYRPPAGSKYLPSNFEKSVDEIFSIISLENKETILMGDMNINFMNKKDNADLKALFTVYGFEQMIKKATRTTKDSSTLIDIILTNNPASIITTEVLPLSISDHDMIACSRKTNNKRYKPKTVYARNYSNYDQNALRNDLKGNDWTEFYKQSNVNAAWKILKDTLYNAFNTHAPLILKTVKGKFCPWITPAIKQHLNQRDRILRKARKTGNDNDWSFYKRLRNSCNNQIKCAKYKYNKKLLSENSQNPKKFWKVLKDIIPTKPASQSTVTSIIKSENEQSSNSLSKADVFCRYFSTVAESLKKLEMPQKEFTWNYIKPLHRITNETFRFQYVSNVEVQKELKMLKRNKSAGIDNLPPNLLRDCAEAVSPHLSHLINLSLSEGIFPDEWKTAKVVPIHKSGKREMAGNYRPISLLPIVSKLMEKVVHRQLITFLEKNNLLTNTQFGYRTSRSTELATTLLLDSIRK
jgi:hypothetical protein